MALDYSKYMGSVADVVREVCRGGLPGEILKLEYRLVPWHQPQRASSESCSLHRLGVMSNRAPEATQPAALKQQLRKDQLMLLAHMQSAEAKKRPIDVTWCGTARILRPQLVVGEKARVHPDLKWKDLFADAGVSQRGMLVDSTCETLARVFGEWGTVVQVGAMVEVEWSLPGGALQRLALSERHWQRAPRHEVLRVGSAVHVRYDHDFVDQRQLGTVLNIEGQKATVWFPTSTQWQGSLTQLRLAEQDGGPEEYELRLLELRVHVRYSICGSILSSAMGSGKTAVILALLASTPDKASLVVVPSELHGQWMAECEKWFGGSFDRSCLKAGNLTVWAPNNLQRYREGVHAAASKSVVLLPDKLFKSKGFPLLAKCSEGLFHPRRVQWHRLVVDEAHLLYKAGREVQEEVLSLRAGSVHAVSATPQQGSGNAGASALLRLMGGTLYPFGIVDNTDRDATKTAQTFFESFAVVGPSPCSTRVVKHEVRVQLSDVERVLYDSAVGRHVAGRDLLDLCSCFVRSETSAMREVGVLLKLLRKERDDELDRARAEADFVRNLASALEQSELAVQSLRRLSERRQRCRDLKSSNQWRRGRDVVDELFASPTVGPVTVGGVRGVKSSQILEICGPLGLLDMAKAAEGELKQLFKDAFDEQLSHLSGNYERLGQVYLQLEFLEQSARQLDEACMVCLEDLSVEPACSFRCGHKLHQACYHELAKRSSACPTCRRQWQRGDVFSLTVEGDAFKKYGTKVQRIVEFLQSLQRERPKAKVLLFAQYETLRKKLLAALNEFKLPCVTMQGSAEVQSAIQRTWQSDLEGSARVMLLSMEKHSAGLHLTAADVVVFAHPPLASNAAEAMQLEAQAIGRACRVGQRSEEVNVWRFVTDGTVEAQLAAQNSYSAAAAAAAAEERAPKRARH